MSENRDALGVSKLVVSGESGGANLSLGVALKLARESDGTQLDGVYVQCPYISNAYHTQPDALPSLRENDGYFMRSDFCGIVASIYDRAESTNPLAWPYHASVEDLRQFPPTVVSVNELDPLRDEGLAFYRKLLEAGVAATSRTLNGTSHASEVMFHEAIGAATRADIAHFARGL